MYSTTQRVSCVWRMILQPDTVDYVQHYPACVVCLTDDTTVRHRGVCTAVQWIPRPRDSLAVDWGFLHARLLNSHQSLFWDARISRQTHDTYGRVLRGWRLYIRSYIFMIDAILCALVDFYSIWRMWPLSKPIGGVYTSVTWIINESVQITWPGRLFLQTAVLVLRSRYRRYWPLSRIQSSLHLANTDKSTH